MLSTKKVNESIENLWKEYKKDQQDKHISLWPLIIPDLEENCILFIGLNPAFPEDTKNGKGYWYNQGIDNPKEYFKFSNSIDKRKEIEREKNAKNPEKKEYYAPFFGPIVNIMKDITKEEEFKEEKWEHLDLFFIRETSQNEMKKNLKIKKEGSNNEKKTIGFSDFAKKQLDVSLNLIKELKPKIIVVQNALASKIISQEWKINESNFNEEQGFHTLPLNNGQDVPIFFSSILSGGRLDNGSLKRLKWHIKRALEFVKKSNLKPYN
jgi:hypothetical protein